ncbi:hypothetical protein KP509_30G034500 [Ceratopteris richardii]|nr:hypothetical protein KP509_30G034500 [Ceratopteris richardii]
MGHGTVVATAAPHTFLLAWQVLSDLISGFCGPKLVSPPSRALVPILYNSGRLVSIWAWLQADFASSIALQPWLLLGRCLALANLALWTYNLFGFLLPIYLPFCFQSSGAIFPRKAS